MSKVTHRDKIWAGIVYLLLGVVILLWPDNSCLSDALNLVNIARVPTWCLGWTSLGIAAALINSRTTPAPSPWFIHYPFYWGFVLYVVSLASFVIPNLAGDDLGMGAFSAFGALIGLLGGFVGDRLREIALSRWPLNE